MLSARDDSPSNSVLENIISGIFTDDSQTRQQYLSIVGLLYQAGINVALCAVAFLLFVFLRPKNARVYARRYKALANDERRPPKIGRGLFAWVPILWRADERFLLDTVDVDSVFFLRFLKLGMWLMGIFALVGMCLIVPLNFSNGNNENVSGNLKDFALQWITLYHITKLKVFWLHVACAYLFSGIFFYFIWRECGHFIRVRQAHFSSPSYLRKLQSRTIMVTRLVPELQNDGALRRFVSERGSTSEPAQVSIARKVGELQDLINDHEKAVRKLERVLQKYLKGDIQSKPRPQIKINGAPVDAIEHYTEEIESLEHTITQTRRETDTFTPTSVGFVSYASPTMAHDAMRSLKRLSPAQAMLSPHPKDVIWSNAQMARGKRRGRLWSARLISIGFCFVAFWPVAALTFIGDASNIQVLWPQTSSFFMKNSTLTTIWQTTFSPLVLALYYIAIPHVFRAISRYQGISTHTGVERSVLKKMYVFYFLSNIIVFTIIGLIVRAVFRKNAAADVVSSMPADFIQALNQKAQFWTAYISLKGVNAMLEFAQLISLTMIFFKRYTRHLTPRELRDLTKPPEFDYSPIYSLYLWVFTISMLYSVYAPIAMPFAFLDFVLAYWVYKYAVMYVYQTRHDTAGAMWRNVIDRMIVSMVIFQVYLIGCLKVRIDDFIDRPDEMRSSWPIVYTLIPLPVITAAAGIWLHLWLNPHVNYMKHTADVEAFEARKAAGSETGVEETLGDRFLHPIFSQPLPTPMVDKRLRHLLPKVYRGRSSTMLDGKRGQMAFAGEGKVAPSIGNASTVFGSDTMDLESVMDERDRRDFDGTATPVPFLHSRTAAANGERGLNGHVRNYSLDSNTTNGDVVEMANMGIHPHDPSTVHKSDSRANLLYNAQPISSQSQEFGDYDGNATVVGRSTSGSPEANGMMMAPANGAQGSLSIAGSFDAVALYGDPESRAASRSTNNNYAQGRAGGAPTYNNAGDYGAPAPWYNDGFGALPAPSYATEGRYAAPRQPPAQGRRPGAIGHVQTMREMPPPMRSQVSDAFGNHSQQQQPPNGNGYTHPNNNGPNSRNAPRWD
ncbi:hypothetical protein H4R20_001953 [Coemansia guatemalensis]|uniref:DUF221-domain-containing protein n=1 Tax=Coemansia guatemalensis TaxID=2761395 RepID=A0A9W8HY64_9FUNG|nr:hypothetical protein H4R20_001953 [Coemansia guatemalensis]